LLGAVAYATHTRVDACVFISALQRHNTSPLIIHVKRLNRLTRWLQRNPKRLRFARFGSGEGGFPEAKAFPGERPTHLRNIGDAAFRREGDTGHALRGALFVRCPGNQSSSFTSSCVGHILDYDCKGQRHVCRSTFAAELLSAGDTIDKGLLLAQQMHEMLRGALTAASARNMRFDGGFCVPLILYVDAMSVYAAVTATFIKTPAEKSLLCHIQFVRELLDRGVFQAMCWLDTRDMLADGLTKGCVDRSMLHQAMDGQFVFKHEVKTWTRKKGAVAQYESPTIEGDDKELDTFVVRSSLGYDWSGCLHVACLQLATCPADSYAAASGAPTDGVAARHCDRA